MGHLICAGLELLFWVLDWGEVVLKSRAPAPSSGEDWFSRDLP